MNSSDKKTKMALQILKTDIEDIPDVNTWARKVGITPRWLSKIMNQEYGSSPKEILKERRYKRIRKLIKSDSRMIGYCIALESGLKNEQALSKFLSKHFDTGLKDLRRQILAKQF